MSLRERWLNLKNSLEGYAWRYKKARAVFFGEGRFLELMFVVGVKEQMQEQDAQWMDIQVTFTKRDGTKRNYYQRQTADRVKF